MTIVCTDMDSMTRSDSANNRRYLHDDSHIQLFHLAMVCRWISKGPLYSVCEIFETFIFH